MVENTITLEWEDCRLRAEDVASQITRHRPSTPCYLYGIPKGGIHAALLVQSALHHRGYFCNLREEPEGCHFLVDDVIDTGNTRTAFSNGHTGHTGHDESSSPKFLALVDKQGKESHWNGSWIEFPWERMNGDGGIRNNIVRILEWIGEDPKREGLKETPDRVMRSYQELLSGYKKSPADLMKTFSIQKYDEMALLKGCPFYSMCEHHMLIFKGVAHIAYLPNGKVIGLSKLARLLDIFSHRLQIQEQLTEQITAALDTYLSPKGSACVIEATHSCMSCRGAKKENATFVTSSLTGAFRRSEVRSEFFHLIR